MKNYRITGAPSGSLIKGIPSREQLFDALRLGVEAGGLNIFGFRLETSAPEKDRPLLYIELEGVHTIKGEKNIWFIWGKIEQLSPGDRDLMDKELDDARFIFGKINTQNRVGNIAVSPTSFFKAPELKLEA